MTKLLPIMIVASVLAGAGVAIAVSISTAPADGPGYGRACLLGASPWVAVSTSNAAAAYTAALTPFQRYAFQCDDDTYFNPAAAGSGEDAASGHGWIPAGAWYEHIVLSGVTYVSLKNKNIDSDCRYALCQ